MKYISSCSPEHGLDAGFSVDMGTSVSSMEVRTRARCGREGCVSVSARIRQGMWGFLVISLGRSLHALRRSSNGCRNLQHTTRSTGRTQVQITQLKAFYPTSGSGDPDHKPKPHYKPNSNPNLTLTLTLAPCE